MGFIIRLRPYIAIFILIFVSTRANVPAVRIAVDPLVNVSKTDVPAVRIAVDPRVNVNNVREGDDVYVTCLINVLPSPTTVSWYHNDVLLNPNSSIGFIVTNIYLVIKKITRSSSGSYSCKAHNDEGIGESRPLTIRVKFPPVCSPKQNLLYSVVGSELVNVYCSVDAYPPKVLFEWHFNNSLEIRKIPEAHITNNLTVSKLTFTPSSKNDYGSLICSSSNSVGRQKDPCIYNIFPASPPDTLRNCSVINECLDSIEVHCFEGFDGGLPQFFIMEVYETRMRKLKSNVTSKRASFLVRGLPSGLTLTTRLYAANKMGRSPVIILKASTLSDRAEKHTFGVIGGLVVVFMLIVVVMVVRRHRGVPKGPSMQQDDSSFHILKKGDTPIFRLYNDQKDPDVIPKTKDTHAPIHLPENRLSEQPSINEYCSSTTKWES